MKVFFKKWHTCSLQLVHQGTEIKEVSQDFFSRCRTVVYNRLLMTTVLKTPRVQQTRGIYITSRKLFLAIKS